MRVLVTGASGLIGSAVADALLARGDEVVGLSRDPERARRSNPTLSWHSWSGRTERPPAEAFEGVEGVINLVGEEINQRLTPDAKARIHESRVRATKNLVDGLLAARPRPSVLVQQSAVGYYGDRGAALLDESSPRGECFVPGLVDDWEHAAEPAGAAGVRLAVIRTGVVLTPDGGMLRELLLPFKLGVGGPLAGGDQYVSWIHRDDEVALLLWALDNPSAEGTYVGAAPAPATNAELSKALGGALGRPAVVPVPKLAVSLLRGGELADVVTSSQRAVPRRALDQGFSFRFTEVDAALNDLLAS